MNTTTRPRKNGKKLRQGPWLPSLILGDPLIGRDAHFLDKIRDNYVDTHFLDRSSPRPPHPYPLYYRYRLKPFPIIKTHGLRLPRWRDTTTWFKVQLASMVLHEIGFYQFRMNIDGRLLEEWNHDGKGVTTEIRNRLTRHLKERFGGNVPMTYFIVEAHNADGEPVKPHIHGGIAVPYAPQAWKAIRSNDLQGQALLTSREPARRASKIILKRALLAASGATHKEAYTPLNARRSMIWTHAPTQPYFNTEAVDYAFKNVMRPSTQIGDQRVVILNGSNGTCLRADSKALWDVIRGSATADNRMGLPPSHI